MNEIPLTQDKVALVDDRWYDELAQFQWFAYRRNQTFYAARQTPGDNGHMIRMHNVILPPPNGFRVDHEDRDGLNNQTSNLRIVTHQQNCFNKKLASNNTSGYKGVSWWTRQGAFAAQIRVDYKRIFLGFFASPAEAALAYDAAALDYFGEYAALNFPGGD
jgi:hypothetical protein